MRPYIFNRLKFIMALLNFMFYLKLSGADGTDIRMSPSSLDDNQNSFTSSNTRFTHSTINGSRCVENSPLILKLLSKNSGTAELLVKPSGSFVIPDSYPANYSRTWVICAEHGQYIIIDSFFYRLQEYHNCKSEYLNLCNGCHYLPDGNFVEGKQYRLCGKGTSPLIVSSFGVVTVKFKSAIGGSRNHSSRFQGGYEVFDFDPRCGGMYSGTDGGIMSPGFPKTRPKYFDCFWEIHVPIGQRIHFTVLEFTNTSINNCNSSYMEDYLQMIDGVYNLYPFIQIFTASSPPSKLFTSNSNAVQLRFYTGDCCASNMGFKILWNSTEKVCNETMHMSSGFVSPGLPSLFDTGETCWWKIVVNSGNVIRFTFLNWERVIRTVCVINAAVCSDYMLIREDENGNDDYIRKWCRDTEFPSVVETSTNSAMVLLKTNPNGLGGIGFRLRFEAVCTRTLKGFRGVIESINYPQWYPSNVDCSWIIEAANNSYVILKFTDFDLREDSEHKDYVEISNKHSMMYGRRHLTGTIGKLPLIVRPAGVVVEIRFKSHSKITKSGRGFRLEWKVEGCGGEIIGPEGILHTPNYPHSYPHNSHCTWKIVTSNKTRVVLTIHDYNIENSSNCHYDGLKIYSGRDDGSNLLTQLCGNSDASVVLTSDSNAMFLEFHSDESVVFSGFNASFQETASSKEQSCAGSFTAPSGYIYSHNYPNNYHNLENCTWYISVNPNYIAALIFLDITLEGHSGRCKYDNITVFDGHSASSYENLLALYCDKTNNTDIIKSYGNSLTIRFQSDFGLTYKGFRAKYFQTCGATLRNESGVIRNPEYVSIMNGAGNCSWTIEAPDANSRVVLMFINFAWHVTDPLCTEHNVRVYDGPKNYNQELQPLYIGCCNHVPPPLISYGNTLTFDITNADALKFYAMYFIIPPGCTNGTKTPREDFRMTLAENYQSELVDPACVSEMTTERKRISVTFQPFLEQIHTNICDTSFVEIYNNISFKDKTELYCRKEMPFKSVNVHEHWVVRLKITRGYSQSISSGSQVVTTESEERTDVSYVSDHGYVTRLYIFKKTIFIVVIMVLHIIVVEIIIWSLQIYVLPRFARSQPSN